MFKTKENYVVNFFFKWASVKLGNVAALEKNGKN